MVIRALLGHPSSHWMIFLFGVLRLSDLRSRYSEFMMVSIYLIKSHFTLKMYNFVDINFSWTEETLYFCGYLISFFYKSLYTNTTKVSASSNIQIRGFSVPLKKRKLVPKEL